MLAPSSSRPRRCSEQLISSHFGTRIAAVRFKFFEIKILPVSDCAPRFYSAFSANSLMAKIPEGGGTHLTRLLVPFWRWPIGLWKYFWSIRGQNIYVNTSGRQKRIVSWSNGSTVTSPASRKCDIFSTRSPQNYSPASSVCCAARLRGVSNHRRSACASVPQPSCWRDVACNVFLSTSTCAAVGNTLQATSLRVYAR